MITERHGEKVSRKALNRKDRNRDARGAKGYAFSLCPLRLLCDFYDKSKG
jgi:hypothetical protein